jgi:integrase
MATKFTTASVSQAPPPSGGKNYVIHRDAEVSGLGLRVGRTGSRNWILNYRAHGIGRRLTIGSAADWPLMLAREEARRLNRLIDQGHDPLAEREARRTAPTVADLVAEWRDKAAGKLRKSTRDEYEGLLAQWILPELGTKPVADVRRVDIERLHHRISQQGTATRANRVLSLTSRLFNLAIGWEMRPDSPVRKIERNHEEPRYRVLEPGEFDRLLRALLEYPRRQQANIFKLALLTGARRGELRTMQWNHVDLSAGVWTKPATSTRQKRQHHVPLNAPARQLLAEIRGEAEEGAAKRNREPSRWVFPAGQGARPLGDVKRSWATLCRNAQIADLRLHDLRHVYATIVASSGTSLRIVGELLGHSQASTTQRYAHLHLDPLREATERVGTFIAAVESRQSGAVLPLRRSRNDASRDAKADPADSAPEIASAD